MTQDHAKQLQSVAEEAIARALRGGATVAEASAREGSHLSAKVRMRAPELVEEAGSRSLGLRVMIGRKVAVSHTSDLSAAGVERLVEDALELARLSQEDPFAGPPDPSLLSREADHADLASYDPTVDSVDGAEAIRRAIAGESAAFDADPRITNSEGATFSRATGASVLVTSGGFRGTTRGSYVSVVVSPVADDDGGKKRSGYHWAARRHLADLEDAADVGREAARRTLRKLGAGKIDSREMPVVFEADAARSLVGLFAGCILGSSIWRRSSYLVDRLGTDVASPLVTLIDDPLLPKAPGSRPFDGEGLISRRNVVVEAGVLRTYLLDSYSARKLGLESTGSASRGASAGVGASTSNFVLQPGTVKPADIVKDTKLGLYVTDMMGFGFNGVTGDFSRGASGFLIENGELTRPVSEVTISLNLDELLKRIDVVGDDLDLRTSTACPTFRVSAMTVAGR